MKVSVCFTQFDSSVTSVPLFLQGPPHAVFFDQLQQIQIHLRDVVKGNVFVTELCCGSDIQKNRRSL